MARKKTRKQKQASRPNYSLVMDEKSISSPAPKLQTSKKQDKQIGRASVDMFAYDPSLIVSDIRKTGFVAILILTIQLGFYFYW